MRRDDGLLEFDALVKHFGDKPALNGLSLQVRAGELFGFCGANGSGKTTAMRIALGVLAADRGEVRWRGAPLDAAVRRRIGYMPEERGLYGKLRPVDQLAYFAELSGVAAKTARHRAAQWLERLQVKADPADTVEKLSLGNQQKVQLIAALIHDPEIVVLDEPFSGLDPGAVDAMVDVLHELTGAGVPVMFSSHQLDLVERLCDRVGIIHEGRQVAVGTVPELRARAPRRVLRIRLSDAPAGWPERLPGVRLLRDQNGRGADFEVIGPVTTGQILSEVNALGTVEQFGWREPTLAEIFREVVQ